VKLAIGRLRGAQDHREHGGRAALEQAGHERMIVRCGGAWEQSMRLL